MSERGLWDRIFRRGSVVMERPPAELTERTVQEAVIEIRKAKERGEPIGLTPTHFLGLRSTPAPGYVKIAESDCGEGDGISLYAATHPPDPLEAIATEPEDISDDAIEVVEIELPMPEATEIALQDSIDKWRQIVAGTETDEGTENCALCRKFHADYTGLDEECCVGCPVMAATGEKTCQNSPHIAWCEHTAECEHEDTDTCNECLRLALAELNFLVGLLPSDAKKEAE